MYQSNRESEKKDASGKMQLLVFPSRGGGSIGLRGLNLGVDEMLVEKADGGPRVCKLDVKYEIVNPGYGSKRRVNGRSERVVRVKYRRTAERLVCPLAGCDGITPDLDCLE